MLEEINYVKEKRRKRFSQKQHDKKSSVRKNKKYKRHSLSALNRDINFETEYTLITGNENREAKK
jgi:hypothetical protein